MAHGVCRAALVEMLETFIAKTRQLPQTQVHILEPRNGVLLAEQGLAWTRISCSPEIATSVLAHYSWRQVDGGVVIGGGPYHRLLELAMRRRYLDIVCLNSLSHPTTSQYKALSFSASGRVPS